MWWVDVFTTYLYGLDFHTFSMRELSTSNLAEARMHIRDQFALQAVVCLVGTTVLALVLRRLEVAPIIIALIAAMSVLQQVGLELYRILTRLGRPVRGAIVLLLRDGAWVPLCLLTQLLAGKLSITILLVCWLGGSVTAFLYGAWFLVRWLPTSGNRMPIDISWLAAGLRTGLRMLAGTISLVALFSVDRMMFASAVSPDELGAYALFALGCASVQGLFETAILPLFWAPLLQATRDGDADAARNAQERLSRACLFGGIGGAVVMAAGLTALAWLLPERAYWANLHLLYYLVAAYSLLTLSNIPHYRLFAARFDTQIVTAHVATLLTFVVLAWLIAIYDSSIAVPFALALACATLFGIKLLMVMRNSAQDQRWAPGAP